jgi:hypothetical protein
MRHSSHRQPRLGLAFSAVALGLGFLGTGILPQSAAAQQIARVVRNVNLRRDPSTNQPRIRLLHATDELALLDTAMVNSYYRVVFEESGDTGWVWSHNVRVEDGSGLVSLVAPPATAVDTSWAKPVPVTGTFHSPVRDTSCGPTGLRGDSATNRRKNRTDVPSSYHATTFAALAGLPYPATRSTNRSDWPPESLAVIHRYEGVAAQIVGYIVALRPQTKGSGESTNCYLTRSAEVDWHVAVVEHAGDGERTALVVEPTPRVRAGHPKWTVARVTPWVDSPDPVRISGWLMFDPAHRNHLNRYRQTLWEIHPVTRIEVRRDSAWVDLDSLP